MRPRSSIVGTTALLRVGGDVDELVGVALDPEIETPRLVDPCLPDVAGFVVLLGVQGRVAEIVEKELKLPIKDPLDSGVKRWCSCGRSAPRNGVASRSFSLLPPLRLGMKEADRFLCRVERAMGTASAQVLEPLSQALLELLVHEGLRRHHHLAPLDLNLEVVSRSESEFVVDLLGPVLVAEARGPRPPRGAGAGAGGGLQVGSLRTTRDSQRTLGRTSRCSRCGTASLRRRCPSSRDYSVISSVAIRPLLRRSGSAVSYTAVIS